MIGQQLDRYRIEEKLGAGGMGVVYKARDTQLARTVAIKILPPDAVADSTRKRRFVQEAKAASALNHPGIVTLHDIRTDAGVDFIVMEYVEGQTLDRVIPADGVPPAQALRYAIEIVDALSKAHNAGIVHRDLKPANVMVTIEDRIKILDFGLAKLIKPPAPDTEPTTMASRLTETGLVMGTAAYMSPEQAEGREVDARSDIFSFGALLYHMVTGCKPFAADSILKVLAKVLNEDPVPPRHIAAVPEDLEKIIIRCLRKDPARRFQTSADLKVALEDIAHEEAAPPGYSSPARERPRAAQRLWAATAIVMMLAAGAAFIWRARLTPEIVEHPTAVPLTTLPGVERSPSFSPDGNHVVFSWNGPRQDNRDIYVQQIGSGEPLRLTSDPAIDYNPVWSPDGRWIAFLRGASEAGPNEVRLVPPLGGAERKVAEIEPRINLFRPSARLAWCPDGTCVLVTDSAIEARADALFVVSLESGERRQLTHPVQAVDTEPAISPDEKSIVFRRSTAPFTGALYRMDLGTGLTAAGDPNPVTEQALGANHPAWMPNNREVVFSARNGLWRLDVNRGGKPTRLPFVGDDGAAPAVSRPRPGQPARLAYVRSSVDTNIWRVDRPAIGNEPASRPSLVISSTRIDAAPDLSPDGQRVAFISNRSGEMEIWTADVDGSNAAQVTSVGATPGFPRWSPDGQLIAFHSNPEGQAEVWVVPATGGKPRNMTSHPALDAFPTFSHDGRWIFFISNRSGGPTAIWKVPTGGGNAVQVATHNAAIVAESPRGTELYYSGDLDRSTSLFEIPTTGGHETRLLNDLVFGSFAVIAGGIYYVTGEAGENTLQYFDFRSRRSTAVARDLGYVGRGLTTSQDGRTILYTRADSSVDDLMVIDNFR